MALETTIGEIGNQHIPPAHLEYWIRAVAFSQPNEESQSAHMTGKVLVSMTAQSPDMDQSNQRCHLDGFSSRVRSATTAILGSANDTIPAENPAMDHSTAWET